MPLNEGFICGQCQANVPPAKSTYRNHCPKCLTSKHVDQDLPGDRLATCLGFMPTIGYEGTDPDKLDLVQQCTQCHLTKRNRLAPDDDHNILWSL
ncbi:RNHCP domain-containing protein [Patescibacteria group bacterium]|nr:RNHCP domain-containing protein [Patescibacteria group bacterium]